MAKCNQMALLPFKGLSAALFNLILQGAPVQCSDW